MFGLGFWEIGAIVVIALVVLGPKNLPSFAKTIAKGVRELRGASEDFRATIDEQLSPERRPLPARQAKEVEAEVELVRPAAPTASGSSSTDRKVASDD